MITYLLFPTHILNQRGGPHRGHLPMPTIRNLYTNYLAQLHLKSFPQKMPNKAFLEEQAEVSPLCGYRNTQGLLQNCTAKTAGLEDTGVSEGDALHRSKQVLREVPPNKSLLWAKNGDDNI